MNNTYKRNLSFGFGLSLLILLLSSVASYISIKSLLDSNEEVTTTHAFIKELDNVLGILVDAETGQRGYLLTGESSFLDPYRGATANSAASLEKIRNFVTDVPAQQQNFNKLENFVNDRLNILRDLVDKKRTGKPIPLSDLINGRDRMNEVRRLVSLMETSAQKALVLRTDRQNTFAIYTRLIIVIASLLALLITLIFYLRVKKDFEERTKLQNEMIEKDRSISERIKMIHDISNKISLGNYKIRITNEDKDTLGSLADTLNKMAESLEHSFGLLSEKEWLQRGAAELNEKMVSVTQLSKFSENVINFIAGITRSQVGTMYILENEVMLKLYSSRGLSVDDSKKILSLGEGLTGQVASDGKTQLLENIGENNIVINYAAGSLKPKNIIAFPLLNDGVIKGVIELVNINKFSERDLAFIELVAPRIGSMIIRFQNRAKMQELLEETQSQTEELHMQHTELQNLNAELESNTQKIQSSEEELRVQQEELLVANKELKERAYLLQEKNDTIQERNIVIQRKAEELALTTKYKSEFLANMSHELRTPLNSILLLSGLMITNTEKKLGDEYVEYAKVIQSSGNGLLTLIDEILDLSKIESGKMQLEYEDLSIEDMASAMRSLFKPFAGQKEIDFSINSAPDLPATIQTDRMRLEQVLKNLLSNAFKFTPVGGKVVVNISVHPDHPHFISFSVKDTGIGIAEDKQSLIFEAFQQEDGSTRRKFGGTGLGLSISRELVKLLKGKIDLYSEVGKGSEFIAYIPMVAEDFEGSTKQTASRLDNEAKAIQEIRSNNIVELERRIIGLPEEIIEDDRLNIGASDKLLLIVEDDSSLAKVLLDFTRTNGYKGIISSRGDEAIELARKFKPGGVLLDIHLPVKSGWEVMEVLKKNEDTKHIPVHIMSSNKFQKESFLKGADDFIDKPIEFEKIKNIFDKIQNSTVRKEKKVLIVEEDSKHAAALSYFLNSSKINAALGKDLNDSIDLLLNNDFDCVILDSIGTDDNALDKLDEVKKMSGLENLPIIVFTSKNLSKKEEQHLKKYADTILIKTAYSYKRILDEVSLFLHVVEGEKKLVTTSQFNKLGALRDVLDGKTILVADDDVRNIFSLTKALETYKVNVITAIDGREALLKMEENPRIDLILMDMMMPEMDGYDATAQIKQDERFKNIPVIAVTAKAMVGDREKCIQAGASDYITKPVDIDQLLSLLRVWLYEKQFYKINNGTTTAA